MKIYTKTGDCGTTGLFAGPRVPKCHPRISAYGTIDELNALLGIIAAEIVASPELELPQGELGKLLAAIQSDLFAIGAELATPDPDKNCMRLLTDDRIVDLELTMDRLDQELPALTCFILPGGSRIAAQLHLARTVCRRAERDTVFLSSGEVNCNCERVIVYLNRLSDLLFVLARFENHRLGLVDTPWVKPQ